ncbi:MAG TPA: TonB-dependent receptor [Steroidobacteraceae bacterium]|jgi:vitamin B12 transporter|nr:TonB-dependent receptor [Steroidobacteraceae bacterium]
MQRISWAPALGAACLTLFAQAALAADPDADLSDENAPWNGPLATVVVSATRIATPIAQVGSSVTVITAADIAAQQLRTVTDVLKEVPGLNVVQEGGPGGQTSIFMRGTNSNHTKVLIDGIDVSDPSNAGASFDFGQLLASDIERIEILRGPQSGLYGSDAIGGVISITTRSGKGPLRLSGSVEGGTFHTNNETLSVGGSTDDFQYAANVEHLHAGSTPVTPLELLLPGEARINDYDDNLTASTRLGYTVMPGFDVNLVGRFTDAHYAFTADNPFAFPSFPDAAQSKSDTSQYYTRLSAHLLSFDGALDETLGVAYSSAWTLNLDPNLGASVNTGDRVKLDWQGAVRLSADETLVLDAEHDRDAIHEPISAEVTDDAGAVELQSHLGAGLYSALNLRYDDNERFGSKLTWRFAPAYVIAASDTRFSASAGSGFKAPTLGELYQNFPPFFFSNPDLKPETSTGYDLGIEQGLFDHTLQLGATWFRNDIRDLITTDVTGTTYANVGRALTQGVESFIAWQPVRALHLRADYTFTQADDEILHEELLRRPKHKATADALWQLNDALSLDSTVLYVGSWIDGNRDFSIPRLTAPAYTTVNVAANYALSTRWTLFARVDNLFDRHYQDPVGFLQPALGVFAGLRGQL